MASVCTAPARPIPDPRTVRPRDERRSPHKLGGMVVLVLAAWLLVHRSALAWVAREPLGLGLAALGVALVLREARPGAGARWGLPLAALPPLVAHALRAALPIDALDGVALALSTVGLLACGSDRATLRRLPALLLLLLASLPLQGVADALLGWPLRKALAAAAAPILGGVPTATVIAIEGGHAFVDAPCAGLHGLWAGGLLLALVTLARDVAVDARWALTAALGAAVFLVANLLRVVTVVGLHHGLGLPLVAEVVHLPLGVLSFLAAGAVVAALLRPRAAAPAAHEVPASPRWALLVAGWLLAAAVRPDPAPPVAVAAVALPAGLEPAEPAAAELAFAREHGAAVTRGRTPDATVALVASRSWLAHHVPTWCLKAGGWTLGPDAPALVAGDVVRLASATRDGRQATAVWWFQSASVRTDDAAVRVADGLSGGGTWVLVTALVDGPRPADDPALASLVASLRRSVGASLENP